MNRERLHIWLSIDETEAIVNKGHRRKDNIFKRHVDTFFEKYTGNTLRFALLEITTLTNVNAVGEVYMFSHFLENEEQEKRETYKSIIAKVKKDYNNHSISAYKKWYSKNTYLYIGYNENVKNENNDDLDYGWSEYPEQRETRERAKYAFIDGDISHEDIVTYLDKYRELLLTEFGFAQYRHFAIIVKPISLKHNNEVIPIGNLYLHFATDNYVDENVYTQFLNEFTTIYLRAKGGYILKEFKAIVSKEYDTLPYYQPNFSDIQPISERQRLIEYINTAFKDSTFKENFESLLGSLHLELSKYLSVDAEDLKAENTKVRYLRKVDGQGTKEYPILRHLLDVKKNVSFHNALSSKCELKDYLLMRHLLLKLLFAYDFTPQQVLSFVSGEGFVPTALPKAPNCCAYFKKMCIYIHKGCTDEALNELVLREDDTNYYEMYSQCSKSERDFFDSGKPVRKNYQ